MAFGNLCARFVEDSLRLRLLISRIPRTISDSVYFNIPSWQHVFDRTNACVRICNVSTELVNINWNVGETMRLPCIVRQRKICRRGQLFASEILDNQVFLSRNSIQGMRLQTDLQNETLGILG